MPTHQLLHVVFRVDLRMQHRPVMRGSDEGQTTAEELEVSRAERTSDCASGPIVTSRFHEHEGGTGKERVLHVGAGVRPGPDGRGGPLEEFVGLTHVALPRRRAPQEIDHLNDSLRRRC